MSDEHEEDEDEEHEQSLVSEIKESERTIQYLSEENEKLGDTIQRLKEKLLSCRKSRRDLGCWKNKNLTFRAKRTRL